MRARCQRECVGIWVRPGEGRARPAAPTGESPNLDHWPAERARELDREGRRQESWEEEARNTHTNTHTHTLAEEGAG